MPPDLDAYLRHVENIDLPEARKRDLIHTVWRIMESFVDRAFGADAHQQAARGEQAKEDSARAPMLPLQGQFQRHAIKTERRDS